ncbi:MAG: restriction endonuclease [Bacteroidales bacterium]|nr:restriction endonuclease [Bacteroidales bacterium]
MKTSNNPKWKLYEDSVYDECLRIYERDAVEIIKDYHIKGKYSGTSRQVDVWIKLKNGETIVVDAKFYNKNVDIKEVESCISMLKDIGANKGMLITQKAFSKSAISRAHLGEDNFEVDILSIKDLMQFQSYGAIAYQGGHGVTIKPPFGWIVDGTYRGFAPATLYARGGDLKDAGLKKEWMYLEFWDKNDSINTIPLLIEYQNNNILTDDSNARIHVFEKENLQIREAVIKNYPTIEITGYKDFEDFILYGVLFCPDNMINRDLEKLCFVLNNAIPLKVVSK